jgi:Xaa-Pro dipeptidase
MKVKRFQKVLKKKGVDFALLYNIDSTRLDPNLFYFSGYEGIGAMVIPKKKKPFLLVPKMEYERARKGKIMVYVLDKKRLFEGVLNLIKKKGIRHKKIGIDKDVCTLNTYKYFRMIFRGVKTYDVVKDCYRLRQIKDREEIKIIRNVCKITNDIMEKAIKRFKKFRTESEVKAFLECETRKRGAELSFEPIVASGKNSSQPHYRGNGKIRKGFCIIDFGIRYKGYCSDVTRTIYLGKPSKKEQEDYKHVLSVQEDIINEVNVSAKCSELYEKARKMLGKYFTHGLGHGLGIKLHELPSLVQDSKQKLNAGMVFTIEPGKYLAGKYGIRIEDDILLSEKGVEVLTKTKRGL